MVALGSMGRGIMTDNRLPAHIKLTLATAEATTPEATLSAETWVKKGVRTMTSKFCKRMKAQAAKFFALITVLKETGEMK
jgi:hypothetical protein